MMNPNGTVMLKVLRNGKPLEVAVTLGEYPSKEERANIESPGTDQGLQGVAVRNLTPQTAEQLKLPAATKGVVVSQVDPSSRAADAGLQPGDVIQQVNHQAVSSVREYSQAVGAAAKDSPVLLLVDRNGNTIFLAV